jgi:ABC-type transport system substrate-binding protein
VIPPGVPGYVAPDLGLKPGGDPEAARKLLEGKSVPPLHMAVNDEAGPARKKQISLIEANLKAVGLEVVVDPHSDEEMGPNDDGTTWGSSNPGMYFDPKFSGQLQELKSSTEDSGATAKKFVDIANEIQTTAWPFLPTLLENDPEVVGANVTNAGISPLLSQVDLNTLAVKR